MSRKIIVLNGSPRPKGNTSALVEEFARGAREASCNVDIFFLDKMNIHGCKGCFGGGRNPDSPCVQKDDMDKIYPKLGENPPASTGGMNRRLTTKKYSIKVQTSGELAVGS